MKLKVMPRGQSTYTYEFPYNRENGRAKEDILAALVTKGFTEAEVASVILANEYAPVKVYKF
jgi:hypothetical protein